MEPLPNLRMMVRSALFTALIIIGAYISIPVGEVPIVLSDFMVMLCGLLLGWRWALVSVGMYLFLGAIGFPVFAGGSGGWHHFYGPTGGYLAGFLVSAFLIGLLSQGKNSIVWDLIALVCGSASVFLIGVTWLKLKLGLSIPAAIAAGFLPFIPFNIAKMLAAATVARISRPFLQKNEHKEV